MNKSDMALVRHNFPFDTPISASRHMMMIMKGKLRHHEIFKHPWWRKLSMAPKPYSFRKWKLAFDKFIQPQCIKAVNIAKLWIVIG